MRVNRAEAMYLKRIYEVSVEKGDEVTSYGLAKHFGVKTPSSIDVLNRLQRKGLVSRKVWGPVILTEMGIRLARELLHVHRLVECFLCDTLDLPLDVACREAAKLDHLISDEVVRRICERMSRPSRCPHGRAIPHEHG